MSYIKLSNCKYCNLDFSALTTAERANHSRWCEHNPTSAKSKQDLANRATLLNTGRVKSESSKEKIREHHRNGTYAHINRSESSGKFKHTAETKELIRQKALASPHRRLRRKLIDYNGVTLDSTWELALAKRLDSLNVKWVRPEPLVWIDDSNVSHHYFPDFYLPDYDLYIDPKNPKACEVQRDKLILLLKQYPNIKILYTLNECKVFSPSL